MGGWPTILKVPLGTEVRDLDTGNIICELLEHEQEILCQRAERAVEEMPLLNSPTRHRVNLQKVNQVWKGSLFSP